MVNEVARGCATAPADEGLVDTLEVTPGRAIRLLGIVIDDPRESNAPPVVPVGKLVELSAVRLAATMATRPVAAPATVSVVSPHSEGFLGPFGKPLSIGTAALQTIPPITLTGSTTVFVKL